jgi:microcystin-dependent protein
VALSFKHLFQSAKGDGADATKVRPSNWNAEHVITLAADKLIGRDSSGAGAAQEIACTAQGRAILAADTIAALIAAGVPLPSTGDFKPTLKTVADTGWIMCNDGTIGNTSSGATFADVTAQALYTLIWTNVSDTYAPVTGGRGASASADWTAQKKIALTKMLGRALGLAGSGSGLTARTLGQTLGEENHQLSAAEMPSHTHGVNDPQHTHPITAAAGNITVAGSPANTNVSATVTSTTTGAAATGITIQSAGSDVAHNNMQPTSFINMMLKL